MISFTLPIDPTAKGRPRLSLNGHAYTPVKTKRFESDVRKGSAAYKPRKPLHGPLSVSLVFFMRAPQRKVRDLPTCRPDWDNLAKGVCDALNGMFWIDDAQIVSCHVRKLYDWVTRKGRIEIRIEEGMSFEIDMLKEQNFNLNHERLAQRLAERAS